MLNDCALWLSVFHLTLQSAKLKGNKVLHAVKNKYFYVVEEFKARHLTVPDARMIEVERKQKSSGLKKLLKFFEVNFENDDKISTDELSATFHQVEDVLLFCEQICSSLKICLSDFKDRKVQLDARKNTWNEYTVSDLLSEDFWLPFKTIRDEASKLLSVKDSKAFENACLEVLKSNIISNSGIFEISTDDAVKLFSKEGLELFMAETGKLLGDDDIKLSSIKKLLKGRLADASDLKRELQILGRIHKVEISNTLIKKCENFLGIKVLKDVIEPLLELMQFWNVTHESTDSLWKNMEALKVPSEEIDNWSLDYANNLSEEIKKTVNCGDSHFGDVIEVLSESKELVSFLKEVIDEDIRNLIDAVEEHSDQYVREATVSDLIDVHGCLKNLIECMDCDFKNFLGEISKLCNGHIEPTLVKIKECRAHVHSLRALYLNVANRGEMTMEIIDNATKQGKFLFEADGCSQNDCEITMSYERQDQTVTYRKDDIQDLRSRALLLMNADEDSANDTNMLDKRLSLEAFIEQAGLVIEIRMVVNKLRKSGHFRYRKFWENTSNVAELQALNDRLQNEFEVWNDSLEEARRKYYYLNYFYGEQLWTLFDFFSKKSPGVPSSVLTMFRFVFSNFKPTANIKLTSDLQLSSQPSDLMLIGAALQKIFEPFEEQTRGLKTSVDLYATKSFVRPGEVFVAALEEQSTESANVILSLYKNTTGLYPESNQIYFCTSRTSWEEVYLLLLRCFYAPFNGRLGRLYCIANLEALDNEIQFKLVDALRELRKVLMQSNEENKGSSFLLALICRGSFADLIGEQVSTKGHQVHGVSDTEVAECFKNIQKNVCMVTSVVSGLGKSEFVYADAAKRGFRPKTVNISGPMTKSDIMCKVSNASTMKFNCLHLNIAQVNDRDALDDFLFQILITGAIAVGTQIYIMPSSFIYIEIANTTNNWLFDALSITKYLNFCRHNLAWENYGRFVVSQEIGSPVQIVCRYLDVFEKGLLDTTEPMSNDANPLAPSRCRYLLEKYFSATSSSLSYSTVSTFLNVLSQQLSKMSSSTFFEVINLQLMLGKEQHDVRSKLFQTLTDVSKAFASHAVSQTDDNLNLSMTREDISVAINKMKASAAFSASQFVQQMKCMIRWEDDNHLIVVFHAASSDSLTALYRDSSLVPPKVKELLTSQKMKAGALDEFHKMSQAELLQKLNLIACEDQTALTDKFSLPGSYALTPDNILKMALIILRVRARVPVVIVGETGCGKTSLIRYLAQVCKVTFRVFNFHAGIKEEEITGFIEKAIEDARKLGKQKLWIFLDEINTCDHICLLSDIICRRKLGPVSLPPNLTLLAACNPYRLRDDSQVLTTGLQKQDARAQKLLKDEYSCLVYRVNPLPESLLNYVWDYGSLGSKDEIAYIERMLQGIPFIEDKVKLLTELIFTSHEFLRQEEKNPFCVSLRDVNRYKILVQWFYDTIAKRPRLQEHHLGFEAKQHNQIALQFQASTRAIVLALAHCYQSRLSDSGKRMEYRMQMVSVFQKFTVAVDKCPRLVPGSCDQFDSIVRAEQEDYLSRMEMPEGIAKNGALLENVFVLLVCILNRIPVFIVGKPGSSKSLAMQLIRSNLRGRDSQDKYFKNLPQLYIVSYQGSESSTSDGIQKVFSKAMKYKDHTKQAEVLPVVLLDEIGLAEISSHNPLKVLHGLLEPEKGNLPEVAVVGISNWALDPAKMNRAIYLSRPEPNVDDLYHTGVSIFSAVCEKHVTHNVIQMYLKNVAEAYFEYYPMQPFANFHGLRDYYSLVKCLAKISAKIFSASKLEEDFKSLIRQSIERNFGGIPRGSKTIGDLFMQKSFIGYSANHDFEGSEIPIPDLIKDNLRDRESRHLMLITKGDSAIGILKQVLEDSNREFVSIYGSRFEEDLSEDYNYRTLSRIILHMERPCVLILKDLDEIYGSLYDMLNKNYIVVGKKKNCRVALGPFSNPMCHVHDDFRCVVIVEEGEVPYSDPPFLNRFEKQMLRYSDVLNADQERVISKLNSWVTSVSCIQDYTGVFDERSLFVGYHEETLPSLVLWHSKSDPKVDEDVLIARCKENLLQIATTDGVMRLKRSDLGRQNPEEAENIASAYFDLPLHSGLNFLLHTLIEEPENMPLRPAVDPKGLQLLVLTHSNFYTNLSDLVPEFSSQIEKLGAFKSERQLTRKVEDFFASSKDLFILQCDLKHDVDNILLAKSIIENQKMKHLHLGERVKHLCIVLHVQRQEDKDASVLNSFHGNFLCGWIQVLLDCIETPRVTVFDLLHSSETDILFQATTFEDILNEQLFWAFSCLGYCGQQRSIQDMIKLVEFSLACPDIVAVFRQIAEERIGHSETSKFMLTWQEVCAFSKQKLLIHRTYISVLENYTLEIAKKPIAMLLYRIEQDSMWPHKELNSEGLSFWRSIVTDPDVLKLDELPPPTGLECYPVSGRLYDLHFPCSLIFMERMEVHKILFKQETSSHLTNCDAGDLLDLIRNCPVKAEELLNKFSRLVSQTLPDLIASPICQKMGEAFIADVLDVFTSHLQSTLSRKERVETLVCLICSLFDDFEGKNFEWKLATWYALIWSQRELLLSLVSLVSAYKEHPTGRFDTSSLLQELILPSEDKLETVDTNVEDLDGWKHGKLLPAVVSLIATYRQYPATRPITARLDLELEVPCDGNSSETTHSENDENCENQIGNAVEDAGDNDNDVEEESHEIPTFEHLVVSLITRAVFPSKSVLESFQTNEYWHRYSRRILNISLKIDPSPPSFHFLRLCIDFLSMLLKKPDLSLDLLFKLADLGADSGENCMESDTVLDFIMESRATSEIQGATNVLDELLGRYFGRCLDANPDNQLLPDIVRCLAQGTPPLGFSQMGPVVLRILMVEEENPPSVFKELIMDPARVFEDHPCLEIVDNEMKNNPSAFSDLEVICCDHIQKLSFHDICVLDIKSSDDPILKVFEKALDVCAAFDLKDEKHFGLRFITCIAFLKQFLSSVGEVIKDKSWEWLTKGTMRQLFTDLHALLILTESTTTNTLMSHHLQRHLIKTVKKYLPLYDAFQKVSNVFPSPGEMGETCAVTDKMVFNWLAYAVNQGEVQKAIAELIEQDNDAGLVKVLQKCKSFQSRLTLVAVLTDVFLKAKCLRKSKDKEVQLATTITEMTDNLPAPLQCFLKKIMDVEKFHTGLLSWSQESDTATLTKGSLYHHLISILVCSDFEILSCMQRLLYEPGRMQESFVPSSLINTNDVYIDIREQDLVKAKVALTTCPICDIAFTCENSSEVSDKKCPRCLSSATRINSLMPKNNIVYQNSTSWNANIFRFATPTGKPYLTTRQLRPVCFRAINLFVHGCLAASIDIGIDADQSLVKLLGVESPQQAVRLCLAQFEENLDDLAHLLNCTQEDVCLRLHLVLIEGRKLFTESKCMASHAELIKWENEMENLLMRILFQLPLLMKDSFWFGLEENGIVAPLLEVLSENTSQGECTIMQLLRVTGKATCKNLSVFFFNMPQNIQSCYPFLAHVLANGDKVEYLKALHPLVEWAKFVRNTLDHKITRDELRIRKISDFIEETVDKSNLKQAKEMYEAFEKAWNDLGRKFIEKYHPEVKMPRLNEKSPLSWCVVRKDDTEGYLNNLFLLLQELQNKFLEKTLLIASAGSGPVSELLVDDHGAASLPLTSIDNLRKSELILFDWSDDYVKHSQSNTAYGKGAQMEYDLGKIEREFAIELIPGKAFFPSPKESFRQLIFAKELFSEGGTVLRKIGENVLQEELPPEVLRAINTANEHSSKQVRDLLADLELVVCCLKKTGGKPDDSLVSYTEEWLQKFGRQLRNDILVNNQATLRLKHVVALYEAVEDVTTNVNHLDDCYRCEIDDESLKGIKSIKFLDQNHSDDMLLTALKRFVSRYLMGDGNKLSVEAPLASYMADITLWPNCKDTRDERLTKVSKLMPPQICLKHIHRFYKVIHDRVEVRVLLLKVF